MHADPMAMDSTVTTFDDEAALRALAAAPPDPAMEPLGNFPLPWYEAFLKRIVELGINVVTYRDLFAGLDDHDHENSFPKEQKHWNSTRPKDRPTLIIQHDVDNHPFFTKRMVALEHLYGIRSNIFIFVERYSRAGRGASYPIDHDFFREAESRGFVMAYHQNAVQLSGFDLDIAAQRYVDDVEYLRSLYERIEFVVPHGGVGGDWKGQTVHNVDLPLPDALRGNLRWVYNRHSVKVARRWSDGGLRRRRDAEWLQRFDIINDFLEKLEPGTRSFCLVHPQRWGYHVEIDANPELAIQPWYHDVCERYGEGSVLTRKAAGAK